MFSILSKVVDVILGSVLEPDKEEEQNENVPQDDYSLQTSDTLVREQDQQDVLLTAITDKKANASDAEVVRFTGKVSQVFCGHGLVDGQIYFSDENVRSDKPIQVGDKVTVVARQQFKDGGWTADSVTVLEPAESDKTWDDQDDEDEPVVPSGEVGKVTQFRNGEGFINKDISFDISVCQEGYRPCVGDWVAVDLDTNPDLALDNDDNNATDFDDEDGWVEPAPAKAATSYAARVSPLRERRFEGKVTAVMPNHGYIDGDVFFTPDVCFNGYRPRKWDVVSVGAIESSQGKCSWRAVSVVQASRDSAASRNRNASRQKATSQGRGFLVTGQRPQLPGRQHIMSIPRKLPQYPVPAVLRSYVIDGLELTSYVTCLAQALSMENYVQRMDTLLYLEEIQLELDIQEYAMQRVCLEHVREYLQLEVPGLGEGRPSVLMGDAVILSDPVDPDQPQYEGIVHELHSNAVMLKFNTDFHCRYDGKDYNVAFTFNRTSFRRCHQAVQLAVATFGEEVLFPREVKLKPSQIDLAASSPLSGRDPHKTKASASPTPNAADARHYVPGINPAIQDSVRFYNPRLNDRQKAAVIHILMGQARPLPYVIFGPPGTGKTITVVEAILQVLTRLPGSRVIACTPSNSAADLLAERLHTSGVIKMSDMVRLNAFNRAQESIAASILGYCSTGEKLEVLCRFRVVVATCNTAGLLYTADLKAGHFTHAFVDEAGQATEPECLIPAGLVAGADGQVVLAGDPRQLGPVLMSPFAKMYGLELSFLERLMDRLPYQHNEQLYPDHGGFQSTLVTMLVKNYRCHSAILQLPSELFYHRQLQECASPHLTHSLLTWPLLPTPGLPVLFHGVRSEDVREEDSPSWFNPGETVVVVKYLQGLLSASPPVAPHNIGIITPYRKQVEKIRMMTERLGIPKVKVGSVEEFQGQERQAIIISTVRSNELLLRSDIRHVLGFLSNPKRFNVAITRAQALLVVIGNPHVLVQDKHWGQFVAMCVNQGSYTGCELPDMTPVTQDSEADPHREDVDTV